MFYQRIIDSLAVEILVISLLFNFFNLLLLFIQ